MNFKETPYTKFALLEMKFSIGLFFYLVLQYLLLMYIVRLHMKIN